MRPKRNESEGLKKKQIAAGDGNGIRKEDILIIVNIDD